MRGVSRPAVTRDPSHWVEDMTWHRRMYRQSQFRWVPEDPMAIALTWTRGRLVHETPRHLQRLDAQAWSLADYVRGIDGAMLAPLNAAQGKCRPDVWQAGLELLDWTPRDVETQRHVAVACMSTTQHPEAARALRGIPLPNPFSQLWELRQMRGMYTAAQNLIEDALCDLILELQPSQGWTHLAYLTQHHRSPQRLQSRVEQQREERGEPGDPRRIPHQRY